MGDQANELKGIKLVSNIVQCTYFVAGMMSQICMQNIIMVEQRTPVGMGDGAY